MGSDVLIAEALKAGPVVVIMWLLLQRLERRFAGFETRVGDRLTALEARAADGTPAARLATLEARAIEDRTAAKADSLACAGRFSCLEKELIAVWRKIGDRPADHG